MKIIHVYNDPEDVVVETIEDECLICINQGKDDEVSFSIKSVNIDIFTNDGEILMGIKDPKQFESFFSFEKIIVEVQTVDDISTALVECYYR